MTGLVQAVSGPADVAPASATQFVAWSEDWLLRAKSALERARKAAWDEPVARNKERLREVGRLLERGGHAVLRAGERIAGWPKRATEELVRMAGEQARIGLLAAVIVGVGALLALRWYVRHKVS